MREDKDEIYRRRAVGNIFNELLGRGLVMENIDREGEVSGDYKTLEKLRFVKRLCRACYDDLCFVEGMRITVGEYMGEEDVKRYRELLNEIMYRLEELSDMLEIMEERMKEEKGVV